jgi:hypothetical protein
LAVARSALFNSVSASAPSVDADTDARRDGQILMADPVWLAHRSEYLVSGEGCIFRLSHFREQHHEFIPTLATDGVRAAHAGHQAPCDRLWKLIADRNTQGVVDVLEVIHIQE